MPIYTLICKCGLEDEVLQEPYDSDVEVLCDACGEIMTRRNNRAYYRDVPDIQGDTVAGGCNYSNYYDEGLEAFITSKEHRAKVMKEKGLSEYSPDPMVKHHFDEAKYIRQHAPKGDRTAAAAARAEVKQADQKRKRNAIKKAIASKRSAILNAE